MEKLAKRIRSSNQKYFDAGVDAGTQKACDLLLMETLRGTDGFGSTGR